VQELTYHIEFFTATILRWQHLLTDNSCRQIILNSLEWLSVQEKCKVHAFVIMPNHIHMIWKIADGFTRPEVQGAFLSFTSHKFKEHLKYQNKEKLKQYYVDDADRIYQFWERDSRVKECWSEKFLLQKLQYIHNNPCQPHWNLVSEPNDYECSSASFYHNGISKYTWLVHYAS
jgi:REP element-mobilizing transposase RayT